MASSTLVQTRIDPDVKERASAVLEGLGLTVSDAVRIPIALVLLHSSYCTRRPYCTRRM